MFKRIDDDEALIVENGVYRPAEVYEGPGGGLYLKAKGGFVRVKNNGSTSHPTVKLHTLARDAALFTDQFGRLCVTTAPDRKEVQIRLDKEGVTLIESPKSATAIGR